MISALLDAVCRDTDPTAGIDIDVPTDDVLRALDNPRRREAIRRIAAATEAEDDPALPLGELAEYVAAVENGVCLEAITSDDREAVYVALYQNHLPQLERAGIVTVDDRNVIRPAADIGEIADLLTVVEDACAEGDSDD